jgi:hypothetical protein
MTSGMDVITVMQLCLTYFNRPDYAKLSVLRQMFPNVPIMALSATCPPTVLSDLISILRLKKIVDGSSKCLIYLSHVLLMKGNFSCNNKWHCLFFCTTLPQKSPLCCATQAFSIHKSLPNDGQVHHDPSCT